MAAKKDLLLVFDPSFLLQRYKPLKKTKVFQLPSTCTSYISCTYTLIYTFNATKHFLAFTLFSKVPLELSLLNTPKQVLFLFDLGSFAKQKMIMEEFLDDKMVDHENEDKL